MRMGCWVGRVALAASMGLVASCEKPAPPPKPIRPVLTMLVAEPESVAGRKFPGRAKATQEVDLSFRVAGTIAKRTVKVGDRVKAGDVVADLDPRDFQVSVADAKARVALAESDIALAQEQFKRVEAAFRNNAATEFEMIAKREAVNAAKAQLDSAKSKLDAANDTLGYATLKAPFDGVVVATYAENFEDVAAQQPVARILDDMYIEIVVNVPEHMINQAPTVRGLRCSFDALPGVELDAKLKEIGSEADATTRTYPITLIMDQPPGRKVLPGMTGNAWATQPAPPPGGEAGYLVPISAVAEQADGARYVWVIDEAKSTVARRRVEVGPMAIGGVRIKGVEPGERIVTAGVTLIPDGQKVRLSDAVVESAKPAPAGSPTPPDAPTDTPSDAPADAPADGGGA